MLIDPNLEIERQNKSLLSIDIIDLVYEVSRDTIYFDTTNAYFLIEPFDIFFNPVI